MSFKTVSPSSWLIDWL